MMTSHPIEDTQDSQRSAVISVGDFFQQINWYGRELLAVDSALKADTPYETVGQFFATFSWQGTTVAVPSEDWDAVSDDEVDSIDKDTLTLEDLSALF